MTRTLFLLLLFLFPSVDAASDGASQWALIAEASDPAGDQSRSEPHYDLLASRVETNGTWFAFTVSLGDVSESNQRAQYQLTLVSDLHQHTIYCVLGKYNPLQTGSLVCNAHRSNRSSAVGSSTEAVQYDVVGELLPESDSLQIRVSADGFQEPAGTQLTLHSWVADAFVGAETPRAEVTMGRADEMPLEGSFTLPNAKEPARSSNISGPAPVDVETPISILPVLLALALAILFRRR